MATNTLNSTNSPVLDASWSLGHVPTSAEPAVVVAHSTWAGTVAGTLTCASLSFTGTGSIQLNGTATLSITVANHTTTVNKSGGLAAFLFSGGALALGAASSDTINVSAGILFSGASNTIADIQGAPNVTITGGIPFSTTVATGPTGSLGAISISGATSAGGHLTFADGSYLTVGSVSIPDAAVGEGIILFSGFLRVNGAVSNFCTAMAAIICSSGATGAVSVSIGGAVTFDAGNAPNAVDFSTATLGATVYTNGTVQTGAIDVGTGNQWFSIGGEAGTIPLNAIIGAAAVDIKSGVVIAGVTGTYTGGGGGGGGGLNALGILGSLGL